MEVGTIQREPRVLLAACGSIDATQFEDLCLCFDEWAEVKPLISTSSLDFIRNIYPLPGVSLLTDEDDWASWNRIGDPVLHIELSRWADIMVIAPLSANTLGKIAGGLCDNLLTCIVRAWDYSKPMFVAPAMDTLMWNHTFTEKQLMFLDDLGINLIPPTKKRLASGGYSTCAMDEPSLISSTVKLVWESKSRKKTAGTSKP